MKTPETVNSKASVADLKAVTAVRLGMKAFVILMALLAGIHRDYGHG
ncbi:hypothetical protein BANRA_05460 [Klebsiella pneumoniae]|nr:hypothetical protein BANRA_05460 [Klebsiella pneumoniae]